MGEFVVFFCEVTGFPSPRVQWTRNNTIATENITRSLFKYMIDESTVTGIDGLGTVTSTLTVINLTNIDHGQYICRGLNLHNTENFIGARESASTELFIYGKSICYSGQAHSLTLVILNLFLVSPRVAPVTNTRNVLLWGEPFTISFTVTHAQPVVIPDGITWTFNSASGGNTTTLTSNSRFSFSTDRMALTISSIALEDEGVYTMKAENPGGTDEASVEVEVRGK